MKADRVEISLDQQSNRWLVRIQVGEEVIRRYCEPPPNTDAATLQSLAVQTALDEGYTVDMPDIAVV